MSDGGIGMAVAGTEGAVASAVLGFADVTKSYSSGAGQVEALANVSFAVTRGEFVVILGPSGSGKSTALYLAAGLEQPTAGTVSIGSATTADLSQRELSRLRRTEIGFVFQLFHLVNGLSAQENVALPLRFGGLSAKQAGAVARRLLDQVGLGQRLGHYPSQLSGGELQRVGLARALAPEPSLLLADEPTGSLDGANSRRLLELMREIATEQGGAVVLVTHDEDVVRDGDRVLRLRDGRLERDSRTTG